MGRWARDYDLHAGVEGSSPSLSTNQISLPLAAAKATQMALQKLKAEDESVAQAPKNQ
jgi:hypothetical protein